jgi:uncharacterized membrane protein
MVLAFLIATLVIFSINLFLNLVILGLSFSYRKDVIPTVAIINVAVTLVMVSWNIFALISL